MKTPTITLPRFQSAHSARLPLSPLGFTVVYLERLIVLIPLGCHVCIKTWRG